MRLRYADNGRTIRTVDSASELSFQLVATAIPQVSVPGSATSETVEDQVTTTSTATTYYSNYAISKVVTHDLLNVVDRGSPASTDPSIATLSDNLLTRVTDGTATVKQKTALGSYGVNCDMSEYANATLVTTDWAIGSLAKSVTDAILDRISGVPGTEMPMFSSTNVRSAAFWAADINTTCISPSNTATGQYRAGVAVTAKHVMYARHYPLYVGDVLTFVGTDNSVVTRTVVAVSALAYGSSWPDSDIGIASLDSDLPAAITPCKVPPANLESYLPNINHGILAWGTNAARSGAIRGLLTMSGDSLVFASLAKESGVRPYYWALQSGDSGSPQFLIVNGELVLLCCITIGGNGQGAAVWKKLTEVNALISGLDVGYSLTEFDLTSFPSY